MAGYGQRKKGERPRQRLAAGAAPPLQWARQDLNLGPSDYESAALTD